MFDDIEKLKRNYTDQYVVADVSVPELQRFGGYTGQVKTVNMNGRALVEFNAWNNIGWYDIDVAYLKIVPKPAAEEPAKKHEAKPAAAPVAKTAPAAGEKKLSPLEMARMQGAAKGAAAAPSGKPAPSGKSAPPAGKPAPAAGAPDGGAKKSTADILAAARANKAAAAGGATSEAPAAKAKVSTADVLAAARAKAAAPAPAEPPAPVAEAPSEAAPAAVAAAPEKKTAAPKAAFPPGQRPSVPEILAWCRQHDGK